MAADVEVIAVAGESLTAIGVPEFSVDITLPTLVPAVPKPMASPESGRRLAGCAGPQGCRSGHGGRRGGGEGFRSCLPPPGPAAATLTVLDRLELPARARAEQRRLAEVLVGLEAAAPYGNEFCVLSPR